ncbi:hypothetical protein TEA_021325 [Camellia sinensis var. sinensis]|uniref:Uncharacterized protein n=1 Tax=Camellia sinensis var. sinensis TaxID=542762 RepID=A0A4V3WLT5_CAMSN|nr:hypothetical protein TEA_021325 [Camellia sinensis var. sinensis]
MLDTMGPALQVCNKTGNPIEMKADNRVTITPDTTIEPSAELLPVNYTGLAKFTESCRTLGKANRNQMSGQFTESCRTHEGANRNQCRDSLQSLVGPLKSRTLKRCTQSFKRRAIKRRAQSIKRRAIKRRAIKKRVQVVGEHREAHDARVCLFIMVFINRSGG